MNRKRIAALLLAGLMAVSGASFLTSCKKDKGPVMSRRTNVYAGDALEIPEGINYIQNMFTADDSVYLVYNTEYSIVRDQNGEEQLRKTGYYYAEMNYEYDYIIEEEPVIEVMPYAETAAPVVMVETESAVIEIPEEETSADVDLNGDGIIDAKDAASGTKKELPKSADEIVFGEQYSSVLLPEGWYFDYQSVQSIAQIPLNGGEMKVSEIPKTDPEAYSSAMAISPDAQLYVIMQKWVYDEETQMGNTRYTLERFDIKEDRLITSVDLNQIMTSVDLDPSSYYLGSLVVNSAGHL
ncbi:MAG: hypothetical protein J6E42_10200, partial [Firmicutes bacterium]|nr:hypothetical protein [Bacillota bacterium]